MRRVVATSWNSVAEQARRKFVERQNGSLPLTPSRNARNRSAFPNLTIGIAELLAQKPRSQHDSTAS